MFAVLITAVAVVVTVEERRKILKLRDVVARGSVVEWGVTSDRCFAVVDEDHEQTYYFFDAGEETIVVGDQDVSRKDFPNTDFAVTSVFGPDGQLFNEWIRCHGDRLQPVQTFTVDNVCETVEFEHLSRLPGTLDDFLVKAHGR
ncbi:hypothetical protein EON82_11490 [bacterium]|nr:MAG: hypothetical protein EON82_11490 [bacterium]